MDVGVCSTVKNCEIGGGTRIWNYCNLYGCKIGQNCKIASYVEIGHGVEVGDNCKIEAYAFIPQGVHVGNNVFVGPHVVFTNDKYPKAREADWMLSETYVQDNVSIGANCTVLSGVTLHKGCMIGAGSVVSCDVPANSKWYGPKAENRGSIH